MVETTVKDKVLKAIADLPQEATLEDVMERLYFLYKIEKGLEQVEAGGAVRHEEATKRIKRRRA